MKQFYLSEAGAHVQTGSKAGFAKKDTLEMPMGELFRRVEDFSGAPKPSIFSFVLEGKALPPLNRIAY